MEIECYVCQATTTVHGDTEPAYEHAVRAFDWERSCTSCGHGLYSKNYPVEPCGLREAYRASGLEFFHRGREPVLHLTGPHFLWREKR